MSDLFANPMGLDGFEFVEFAAAQRGALEPALQRLGFSQVARHKTKDVDLWRQGDINFILNYEPGSPAGYYAQEARSRRLWYGLSRARRRGRLQAGAG